MRTAVEPNVGTGDETGASKPVKLSFHGTSSNPHTSIPAEAQASLERLLASESINRAPRLRAVLKFMIDALLEGRAETINEQVIGEAVFNRPMGYNPGEDNIVRVTIRHLRDRIEKFYRTDGRDERYIFKIPKGRYAPILSCPHTEQPASSVIVQVPLAAEASEELSGVAAATGTAPSPHRLGFVLSWVLVGLLAATVAVLGFRLHRAVNTRMAPRQDGLLSLLLANGQHTTVVVMDSNLEAYRMIFGKTVPLDAYLDRSYLNPASDFQKDAMIRGAWNYVRWSPQTNFTSTIIASEIQAASIPEVISIKYPQDLSMRDIEHGNYIFLGGPWIDPWEQLFESRLNFRITPLPDTPWLSNIHNMNPLPSEPAIFALHSEGALTISYVRLALLRNQSNDGYIVLLGGTTEEAVEAGERFFVSERQMETLLKTFQATSPEKLPSIEVVIETMGLQGVPESFRVVAERIVKPQ